LLELLRTRNAELHRCAIPCDEFADEETAPYFGEPSSFFDFVESLPPCLMNRFNLSLTDELSVMATASTFDDDRLVRSGENDCAVKSTSDFLSGCRGRGGELGRLKHARC
jgi:hypothetical protein